MPWAPRPRPLDLFVTEPKGPLRALTPLVDRWTRRYGFAEPGVDFTEGRPWKATMERYLAKVSYGEQYFATMFLCYGEKA